MMTWKPNHTTSYAGGGRGYIYTHKAHRYWRWYGGVHCDTIRGHLGLFLLLEFIETMDVNVAYIITWIRILLQSQIVIKFNIQRNNPGKDQYHGCSRYGSYCLTLGGHGIYFKYGILLLYLKNTFTDVCYFNGSVQNKSNADRSCNKSGRNFIKLIQQLND